MAPPARSLVKHQSAGSDSESGSDETDNAGDKALHVRQALLLGVAVALILLLAYIVRAQIQTSSREGHVALKYPGMQCDGAGRFAPPSQDLHLHFLFMAMDAVHHADIWRTFFEQAPAGSWHAWVHCKFPKLCEQQFEREQVSVFQIVPTVYSAWCRDLVSPMLQLLRSALAAPASGSLEKFLFVSDVTLPLKPFYLVRSTLAEHPDASDFCIFPRQKPEMKKGKADQSAWPYSRNRTTRQYTYLVKASQWSILARRDAETLVTNMPVPSPYGPINISFPGNLSYKRVHRHTFFCPDEATIFLNVFGYYLGTGTSVTFPGVGPVYFNDSYEQGCCRTWAILTTDALPMLGELDLYTELAGDPTSTMSHDYLVTINGLSPKSLNVLRASPYLFGRKFNMNSSFPRYAEIVFA